jgi:prevent-host-death family protein
MSTYSVAEARNQLSALIERAEAGEDVVITRHGRPVVALRAIERDPLSAGAALAWLRAADRGPSCGRDAAETLSEIRDEDWR